MKPKRVHGCLVLSCERDQDGSYISEVSPDHYLNERNLEKVIEWMLDEVADDGERELEWCIRPAIIRLETRAAATPILELVLKEKWRG